MKIGILTFWWTTDNYGQILQCYALQQYLKKHGHEAFLIRYNSYTEINKHYLTYSFRKMFSLKNIVSFSKKSVNKILLKIYRQNSNREFDSFRKKYISLSDRIYESYEDLKNNSPEADIYIVGSDQVWNPNCIGVGNAKSKISNNIINAYFLNFGTAKRISYAASFSNSKLPVAYKNKITPLLQEFDYISVREQEGVKICEECERSDAQWVCDPTMLLNAEDYRKLYQEDLNIRIKTKKYILLYILNNDIKFDINKVYNFAKEKNLEVVYITANGKWDKKEQFNATVTEWLYLIDNAEYVITNSFHCGVFSTIFNKKYGIIPLSGKCLPMNKRFDNLFERANITSRYVNENDFSILENVYSSKIENKSDFLKHIN